MHIRSGGCINPGTLCSRDGVIYRTRILVRGHIVSGRPVTPLVHKFGFFKLITGPVSNEKEREGRVWYHSIGIGLISANLLACFTGPRLFKS